MDLTWAGIIVGALSGLAWFISAVLSFWTGGSYYDGPPVHIRRIDFASKMLNAFGALGASVAVAIQSYSGYLDTLAK